MLGVRTDEEPCSLLSQDVTSLLPLASCSRGADGDVAGRVLGDALKSC